jgi:DNA-3-methyladenine glycosylase
MGRVIQAKELQRPNTPALARWLLGKMLVRTDKRGSRAWMITEVEAYHSERDLACHANKGRTPRTTVLYQRGGVWYVYLCYGVHEMLNLVTGPADHPAAVLIRGVTGISGPGRLTKALGIDRRWNAAPAQPECGLHLEDHGVAVPRRWITATPRVGVGYAGPEWSAKPWRFIFQEPQRGRRMKPVRPDRSG